MNLIVNITEERRKRKEINARLKIINRIWTFFKNLMKDSVVYHGLVVEKLMVDLKMN
jgi:hypothetical protein